MGGGGVTISTLLPLSSLSLPLRTFPLASLLSLSYTMPTVDAMPVSGGLELANTKPAAIMAELESLRASVQSYASEKRELEEFRAQAAKEAKRKRVLEEEQEREVVLRPNPDRFVLLPIQYPELWRAYEEHKAVFWESRTKTNAHYVASYNGMYDLKHY
jgi:hypothetical protein